MSNVSDDGDISHPYKLLPALILLMKKMIKF